MSFHDSHILGRDRLTVTVSNAHAASYTNIYVITSGTSTEFTGSVTCLISQRLRDILGSLTDAYPATASQLTNLVHRSTSQ